MTVIYSACRSPAGGFLVSGWSGFGGFRIGGLLAALPFDDQESAGRIWRISCSEPTDGWCFGCRFGAGTAVRSACSVRWPSSWPDNRRRENRGGAGGNFRVEVGSRTESTDVRPDVACDGRLQLGSLPGNLALPELFDFSGVVTIDLYSCLREAGYRDQTDVCGSCCDSDMHAVCR